MHLRAITSTCTANSHFYPLITRCGHIRLATILLITVRRSYIRAVHLNRKLKCAVKAGVVATSLLHGNQYMRQYYSEHYNRDVQVHNLEK